MHHRRHIGPGPGLGLHLLDRLLQGEIGRHNAVGDAGIKARRFLIEHLRILAEARQVSIGIVFCFDTVLAVKEIRYRLVTAGQLRDRVRSPVGAAIAILVVFVAFRLQAEIPQHRIVIDPVHAGKRGAVDGLQAGHRLIVKSRQACPLFRRRRVDLRFQPGQFALVEAQRGRQHRRISHLLVIDRLEQRIEIGPLGHRLRTGGDGHSRERGSPGQQITTIDHWHFSFFLWRIRSDPPPCVAATRCGSFAMTAATH